MDDLELDPAVAIDRLRRLAEQAAIIERPGFDFGHWAGSEKQPDGSITMPYFSFSPEAQALVGAMPVEVFDWRKWSSTEEARSFFADPSTVADASPEQLIKLSTSLVRGDRFDEGALVGAVESGLVAALARRAAVLVRGAG